MRIWKLIGLVGLLVPSLSFAQTGGDIYVSQSPTYLDPDCSARAVEDALRIGTDTTRSGRERSRAYETYARCVSGLILSSPNIEQQGEWMESVLRASEWVVALDPSNENIYRFARMVLAALEGTQRQRMIGGPPRALPPGTRQGFEMLMGTSFRDLIHTARAYVNNSRSLPAEERTELLNELVYPDAFSSAAGSTDFAF